MTSTDPLHAIPDAFWARIAAARDRLLLIDYDGTIAPFVPDRMNAWPLPANLSLLERIAAMPRTGIAVVSGRPVHELVRFVGRLDARLVGEHGYEMRDADGSIVEWPLLPATSVALEEAARLAGSGGWSERLERKRTGIVAHSRGLDDADARELEGRALVAWEPLTAHARVRVDRILGGVEIRASRRNKGTAVTSLLRGAPRGAVAAYLGDDVTDEDAFAAVRGDGFGIRVGLGRRHGAAVGFLPDVHSVPAFLERWLEATHPESTADSR